MSALRSGSRPRPYRLQRDMELRRLRASIRVARLAVGILVVLLVQPLALTRARASCGVEATPNDGLNVLERIAATAPVAFVGTVIATDSRDRRALVGVESVWRGPDLPATVIVQGSVLSAGAASADDRQFAVGQRYLFVPSNTTSPFIDHVCTSTQRYTSTFAPAAARPPRLAVGAALPTAAAQPAVPAPGAGTARPLLRRTSATSWTGATLALTAVALVGGGAAVLAAVRRERRGRRSRR